MLPFVVSVDNTNLTAIDTARKTISDAREFSGNELKKNAEEPEKAAAGLAYEIGPQHTLRFLCILLEF